MKRMRWAWAMMMIAALLLVGCGSRISGELVVTPVDPILEAIDEADLAAEAMLAAAQTGDLAAVRTAYQRFGQAFGQLLGPVSLADPGVAEQMANANSAIKAMLGGEKVEAAAWKREVAAIRQGLAASAAVMARVREESGSVRREAAPATAARPESGEAAPQARSGPEPRFTVVAVDYKLQPPQLRVKKGDQVTIRFENRGTQRHEFELPDFDVEIGPLEPGQGLTRTFTATKAGVFPYECHVDDHLAKGMKGILIVGE